jgi:hypothetical protein
MAERFPIESPYLDPDTGSYVVEDGRLVMAPAGVAWAQAQIFLERGSIPGYEGGSDLRKIEFGGVSGAGRSRAEIERVLRPGTKVHFDAFRVETEARGAAVILWVTIYTNGKAYRFSVPRK